jgi:hypothetical protein
MPKLTKNDLEHFLERQNLALPKSSPLARLYGLATEVLIHLLGKPWVVNNIFGKRPLDKFLRIKAKSRRDSFKMTDRIIEVSEMLFNFQDVSGIANIIERIKKDSIESCFAELQSARLLYNNKTPFYFNTPLNKKGLDYDAVATIQGIDVYFEFKCKIENTSFSKETIKTTLIHARGQLPRAKPSAIFVKIPEIWTAVKNIEDELIEVVDEFFRRTTRINSIIFYWEEWTSLPTGQAMRAVRFKEEINPNSVVELGKILKGLQVNQSSSKWISFNGLIQNKFGESGIVYPKLTKVMVLGNGFSWHSVLRILSQATKGEHVFYDMGSIGGTRITLLIDKNDCIVFKVIDANLNKFEVKTNEPFFKIGLDNFSYLRFQLTPNFNYSEMCISVNNNIVGRKTVPLNQNSILLPDISLGADLSSKRNIAFEVASIAMYEKSSVKTNKEVTEYYNFQFALEIPN